MKTLSKFVMGFVLALVVAVVVPRIAAAEMAWECTGEWEAGHGEDSYSLTAQYAAQYDADRKCTMDQQNEHWGCCQWLYMWMDSFGETTYVDVVGIAGQKVYR